jgi:hypothetical protein
MEALDQSLFGPGLSQDVLNDCTIRLATLGSSVEVSPDNRVGCSNTSRIEKVRGQPPQEDPTAACRQCVVPNNSTNPPREGRPYFTILPSHDELLNKSTTCLLVPASQFQKPLGCFGFSSQKK